MTPSILNYWLVLILRRKIFKFQCFFNNSKMKQLSFLHTICVFKLYFYSTKHSFRHKYDECRWWKVDLWQLGVCDRGFDGVCQHIWCRIWGHASFNSLTEITWPEKHCHWDNIYPIGRNLLMKVNFWYCYILTWSDLPELLGILEGVIVVSETIGWYLILQLWIFLNLVLKTVEELEY